MYICLESCTAFFTAQKISRNRESTKNRFFALMRPIYHSTDAALFPAPGCRWFQFSALCPRRIANRIFARSGAADVPPEWPFIAVFQGFAGGSGCSLGRRRAVRMTEYRQMSEREILDRAPLRQPPSRRAPAGRPGAADTQAAAPGPPPWAAQTSATPAAALPAPRSTRRKAAAPCEL